MLFGLAVDNWASTVSSAHAPGDGQLHLSALNGLPSLPAGRIYRVTAVTNPGTSTEAILGVFEATGISSSTLTGVTASAGYTDVAVPATTPLQIRVCKATIAELQSALDSLAPASDAITTATALRLACWGDSLTSGPGGTPYPAQLATLINRDCFNGGVGGETSTQIKTRFLADTSKLNYAVVIWSGRNNFSASATIQADIAAMVAALGHTRYLVFSIVNMAGEGNGTTEHTQIVAVNNALSATYGAHYFDIRGYLVSQYNPSIPQDVTDHAADIPPTSLRADVIHLNTAGNLIVAQQVAARMNLLNPPAAYVVTTNMGALLAAPAGPIGSVAPTVGTFTTVTCEQFFVAGPIANLSFVRRDTQANAWQVTSGNGELNFWNYETGTSGLAIEGGSHDAYFTGHVTITCDGTVAPTLAMGSMVIQAYATNNCWFADNLYFSGGFKFRDNGIASAIFFSATGLGINFSPANSSGAGASASVDTYYEFRPAYARFVGALVLPTLADSAAPNSSIYLGSDHPDGASAPKLCRKSSAGAVTVIG